MPLPRSRAETQQAAIYQAKRRNRVTPENRRTLLSLTLPSSFIFEEQIDTGEELSLDYRVTSATPEGRPVHNRTMKLMMRAGWVRPALSGRERQYVITQKGRLALKRYDERKRMKPGLVPASAMEC